MDKIEKLKAFLQENPGDSFLLHALALEHNKAGDVAKAQQLWQQLLQHHPGYVGSYYHLAKLLERQGQQAEAIQVYEDGMKAAKDAGDQHAYNELKNAYDELIY